MGFVLRSALVFWFITAAHAQSPGDIDLSFMPPSAGVALEGTNYMGVMALPDGKLLVHGQALGGFRGIARLHGNGAVDASFSVGSGAEEDTGGQLAHVSGVQIQPDGRLVLNGNFTHFNGTAAPGVVRLQENGEVDDSFRPAVNIQPTLVRLLSDGRLVLRNWNLQLYLLKSDGSLDGTNPLFGGNLFMPTPLLGTTDGGFVMEHNLIYLDEYMAEGKLARVGSSGVTSAEVSWRGTQIEGVPLADGRFVVWGLFTNISGSAVSNLAVLKPDLTVEPGFRPSVAGGVTDVKLDADGRILLVGAFTSVNGVARAGVARLLANGALDTDFAPAGFAVSNAFAQTGVVGQRSGTVISGYFDQYQGTPRKGLLRLSDSGAFDSAFPGTSTPAGPDAAVSAVARSGLGGLFLAGSFSSVSGVAAHGLVRTTVDGIVDTNFNIGSGFNGPVFALVPLTNGGVIAAGQFTSFNGHPCGSIVRLNPDGSRDTNFNSNPGFQGQSATVAALALLPDERVVAGGQFLTYNGTSRDGISRLMANGALDATFNPGTGISSPTNRILLGITVLPNGKMLLNGRFLTYNGVNRGHAARINNNGTLDTTFTGGAGDFIRCLAMMPDGRIVIGGGFTRSIGVDQNRVARWHPDGALDTSFNSGKNLDGAVRGMALQADGRVIVGGLFRNYGATPRAGLARLKDDGTLDSTFDPGSGLAASDYSPTVETMLLQDDFSLMIAGAFETYDGQPRSHVARVFTATPPVSNPALGTRSLADGRVEIRWPDVPGFTLESTGSPDALVWEPVADVPPAQNGQRSYLTAPAGNSKFYRLKK